MVSWIFKLSDLPYGGPNGIDDGPPHALRSIAAPFVDAGVPVLSDEGAESDGCVYPTAVYPDLVYPDDVDWRSIPPALLYRIMALPNALASSKRAIDFIGEHITQLPENAALFEAQEYQFSKLGLMALDLADAIRVGYSIPAAEEMSRSGPRAQFERRTVDEDERRRNAAASIEALVEGATASGPS